MDKREVIVISALLFCCVGLYFYLQYLATALYFITPPLDVLQQETTNLYYQNMGLYDNLLHLESYTYIASVSASEGFVPAHFVPLQ